MTITAQAVGAYGEKIIEAELLRRGWMVANVNASVTNAARFDLVAMKGELIVPIRVKTCGPKYSAFQWSLATSEPPRLFHLRESGDFIAMIAMGAVRGTDRIFLAPSKVVNDAVLAWRDYYLKTPKRDGTAHKETSQWTLHLNGEDPSALNRGFTEKWSKYLDNWDILER